jgi:hypothetical protein
VGVSRGHIVVLSTLPALVASQTLIPPTGTLADAGAARAMLVDASVVRCVWAPLPGSDDGWDGDADAAAYVLALLLADHAARLWALVDARYVVVAPAL